MSRLTVYCNICWHHHIGQVKRHHCNRLRTARLVTTGICCDKCPFDNLARMSAFTIICNVVLDLNTRRRAILNNHVTCIRYIRGFAAGNRDISRARQPGSQSVFNPDAAIAQIRSVHRVYHPVLVGSANIRGIKHRHHPRTIAIRLCLVDLYAEVIEAVVRTLHHIITAQHSLAALIQRDDYQILAGDLGRCLNHLHHLRNLLLTAGVVQRIGFRTVYLNTIYLPVRLRRSCIKGRHNRIAAVSKRTRIERRRSNAVHHHIRHVAHGVVILSHSNLEGRCTQAERIIQIREVRRRIEALVRQRNLTTVFILQQYLKTYSVNMTTTQRVVHRLVRFIRNAVQIVVNTVCQTTRHQRTDRHRYRSGRWTRTARQIQTTHLLHKPLLTSY